MAREVAFLLGADGFDTRFQPYPSIVQRWHDSGLSDPPDLRSKTRFTRAGVLIAEMMLHWCDGFDGHGQCWVGDVTIKDPGRKVAFTPYSSGRPYCWTIPGEFRKHLLMGMREGIERMRRDFPEWPFDLDPD